MFTQKQGARNYLCATLALALLMLPAVASAGGSDLSFESFYQEDSTIFWFGAALAAVAVLTVL